MKTHRSIHTRPSRLGSVSSLADLVGPLKKSLGAQLTRQFRAQLPAALVRRAIDEAERVALDTGFPHLFLPELATEQVRRIHASAATDQPALRRAA
jgi:hypothetical protein